MSYYESIIMFSGVLICVFWFGAIFNQIYHEDIKKDVIYKVNK